MNSVLLAKTYQKAINNWKKASFDESLTQFHYCIDRNYAVLESYFHLGIYYYYTLQYHEAATYFQLLVVDGEYHSGAYYYLGNIARELNNPEEAELYYKKAIDYATDSLYPLMVFIKLKPFLRQDDVDVFQQKAFQLFSIQLDISPQEDILIKAFLSWGDGSLLKAEELLIQAKDINPQFFEPYIYLADFYFSIQNYNQAESIYQILAKKFSLPFIGYKALAKIEFANKHYKKSIFYLKKHLSFSRYIGYAEYFNLGFLYSECKDIDKAIEYFKKTLAIFPQFFPALFNLGVCLQKKGLFEKAIVYYEKAASIDGNNPLVYYNLGMLYFEMDDFLQSLFNLDKAYQIDSNFIEAKDNYYHISYLHALRDKDFVQSSNKLLSKVALLVLLVLLVLSILHLLGVL